MEGYFYTNIEYSILNPTATKFIQTIKDYARVNLKETMLLNKPLIEPKFEYEYHSAVVLLLPGYKCLFIDLGNNSEKFEEFQEDFLEDLGYISDKYEYKKT